MPRKKLKIEDMQEIAQNKGGKCLSKEYVRGNLKLDWQCKEGHQWEASPEHVKNSNSWCPFCAKGRVTSKNSLLNTYPKIAKEWDYEKNAISPEEVSFQSQYRVWWKCDEGHSWYQGINSRTSGVKYKENNCSICSSIVFKKPEILKEWDYKKNNISPEEVRPNSGKKVWWRCDKGHSWEATISNRIIRNSGCKRCISSLGISKEEIRVFCELKSIFDKVQSGSKIDGIEADILLPNEKIVIEYDGLFWHKDKEKKDIIKNNNLKKKGFVVYRLRQKGLKKISIRDVVMKTKSVNIEEIQKLLRKLPKELINKKVEKYLSRKKWINNIEYKKLIKDFNNPNKYKNLVFTHPSLSLEWSKKNNPLKFENYTFGSHEVVWWECNKGHSWEAPIKERTSKKPQGCPYCSGNKVSDSNRLSLVSPEILKEWDYDKNKIRPEDVSYGSHKKVWWRCDKGHSWEAEIKSRSGKKPNGCSLCSKKK